MKTLHNYLTRQVLAALLMTVAVFTFVLLIGNVLKEILSLLVSGHATLGTVVQAVGLLIPFVWVFALPMGLLTAMLLVFGRFSADQELTAVRASGISLLSLIMPVLFLSLLCCGVSAWINMALGPQCRVAYVNLLFSVKGAILNADIPEGQFVRDFSGYVFYTEKNRGGELQGVKILIISTNDSTTTVFAPRGRLEVDAPNKQLILHLFDASTLTTGANAKIQFFPTFSYPLTPSATGTNKVFKPKITDMTFWQLRDELVKAHAYTMPQRPGLQP